MFSSANFGMPQAIDPRTGTLTDSVCVLAEVMLRVPEWCEGATAQVNNQTPSEHLQKGYFPITGAWQQGDVIRLHLPMKTRIIEANPLVEENRGQVAVMRGPLLYCLESKDLTNIDIDDVTMPVYAQFSTVETTIEGCRMIALETEAVVRSQQDWSQQLYRSASITKTRKIIRLIPYFAWGNRGQSEMTVWMPAAY